MTKRLRTSIILLLILAILLLIAWFLFFRKPVDVELEVPEQSAPIVVPIQETGSLTEQILEQKQEERTQAASLTSVAKIFTERYGSYSNEANFANLSDVLPLMSVSFAEDTRQVIAASIAPEEYYGVTSRVITVNIDSIDEDNGVAVVTLTAQREESVATTQNISVKFQDITLEMIQENGVWKVDSASWL